MSAIREDGETLAARVSASIRGQRRVAMLDSSGSPPGARALFGLTDVPGSGIFYVDDATNTMNLLH